MGLTVEAAKGSADAYVVFDGQVRERRRDLMRMTHTLLYQRMLRAAIDALAVEHHRATVWAQRPDDAAEKGGFPGPVGSDQADDLTWKNVQRYRAHGYQSAKTAGLPLNVHDTQGPLSQSG